MKYSILAQFYQKAESTTKRLEKIAMLGELLKDIAEKDADVLYLLLGRIYPEYSEKEIGISNQLAIKAIAKAVGIDEKKVLNEWKKIGDIGEVSEKLTHAKKQSTLAHHTLTTEKVLDNLRKLPELEGKGTVGKKIDLITELLTSATPLEARYLVRTLIGDLRIGIQESSIREALAKEFFKDTENAHDIVQSAIDKTNDIAEVFRVAKEKKLSALDKLDVHVGKPIKAMLAQKAISVEDAFASLGTPCAVEYKYDGFRMIIHKKGKEVTIFTRQLENVTKQFPEVSEFLQKYVHADSCMLDAEAVGYDKKTKVYTSFQAISQRIRRKYDIEKLAVELPVEINVFDIIFYNGKSLIDEPFKKRSELLRKIITSHPYKIITSKQIITSDIAKTKEFYKDALKAHQEGIMLKNLEAPYKPGRRVGYMLKLKPEERDLDLVITGAEYGTGKRSGWFSSFILSCLDGHEFKEIGRVGTGVKEKSSEGISFETLTKELKPLIEKESGKIAHIKPKIVVSVTYQEVQHSPTYNSGFALRFPRFTALRPEKPTSEIATLAEIKDLVKHQTHSWKYG